MPKPLLTKRRGGYRKLHSFTFATVIHLQTIRFCRRFITYKDDPLGKTVGQMVGAARSGRQNIIEGSERADTSRETEIKLTDVARASLAELLGDFEVYLAERGELPWPAPIPERRELGALWIPEFEYTDDTMHDYWRYYHEQVAPLFAPWFEERGDVDVARAMLVLIQRTMCLLDAQLERQAEQFLAEGGFKERMHSRRTEARDEQSEQEPDAPDCPQCGRPMRKRFPRNDSGKSEPFWGCPAFPKCRGTRPCAGEK